MNAGSARLRAVGRTLLVSALAVSLVLAQTPLLLAAVIQGPEGASSTLTLAEEVHPRHAISRHPKVDSAVWDIASAWGQVAAGEEEARSRALGIDEGRLTVVVESRPGEGSAVASAVRHAGGRVSGTYGDLRRISVPVEALAGLASRDDVVRIRWPYEPTPLLTSIVPAVELSEGVAETNASAAHARGYDGAGVKVGVIDVGFVGYAGLLGTELPDTVATWGGGSLGLEGNGTEVHGTAVAETVHDMAPGASLYLAQIYDEVDLGNAVAWMTSVGVEVINTSIGWIGVSAGDGTGIVNEIVSSAVADGMFWASAAGNERQRHWMGDFADADADAWLDWAPDQEVQRFVGLAGQSARAVLTWDDSWTAATQDYDLALFRWNGAEWILVTNSTNAQGGVFGQTPREEISVSLSQDGTYGWAVKRYSATRTDVDFDLFPAYRALEIQVHARSIMVPADNPSTGFMAVGAVGRTPGFLQESYSSEGPTRDGRLAPEIAAPSSTSNSVYGTFSGTSASSPHLAGAAALVRQAYPGFSAGDIETFIQSNAVDLGDLGPDTAYGHGRLWLPDPLRDTTPPEGTMELDGGAAYTTDLSVSVDSAVTGGIEMRIDAGTGFGAWIAYSPSVTTDVPAGDGSKIVTVEYRDGDGNTLSLSDDITLDTDLPETGITVDPAAPDGDNGYYVTEPLITLTSDEPGITFYSFASATGPWTEYSGTFSVGEGSWILYYYSEDLAGNEESVKSVGFESDTIAPMTTSDALPAYETSAAVTLTAADEGSGVTATYYRLDGSAILTYTVPIEVTTLGDHTLEFWSVDNAGNEETPHETVEFTVKTSYTPISGTNRYDTAIKTSQEAFADGTASCVLIATGENWPDALGGAALAAAKNGPILLTKPTTLTVGILGEIERLGATEAIILGGTGAVSEDVEKALEAELGELNVTRIGGATRYETAELIAAAAIAELNAGAGYDGTAFVSTGLNFPDALAASPLAAAKGWPIFLVKPRGNPPTAVMAGLGVTDVLILGGTSVVSDLQDDALEAAFPDRVERLAGPGRYETGVAIATYGVDIAGLAWDGLAMSTGQNFPDALAGGVLAGRNGSVMLLTGSTYLPSSVSDKLTEQRDWIANVYYLGGLGAISQSARDAIAAILH